MNIKEELEKKIVVYTVIVGDYDYLKDPEYIMENCDYVCFTNNRRLESEIWKIVYIENSELDPTRWNRKYKILPHRYLSQYQWSIYVDGNVRLIGNLREYVQNESKGSPMLCLRHSTRESLYDEAEECIKFHKDNEEVIRKQIEGYKREGYKADNGLTVNNILVRKHMEPDVIELMEAWWSEVEKKSCRDQLSFRYVCWKKNFECDISDLKCWKSKYWLNPGIHTSKIENVEKELIDHIQQEAFYEYKIKEQDDRLKKYEQQLVRQEQELKDANIQLGWKEQELKDANTQLGWKEQELKDANIQLGWAEQELKLIKESKRWKLVNLLNLRKEK